MNILIVFYFLLLLFLVYLYGRFQYQDGYNDALELKIEKVLEEDED